MGPQQWADLGGASALDFLRHSCLPQAVLDIPPGGAIGLAVGLERSLMPRDRVGGVWGRQVSLQSILSLGDHKLCQAALFLA